MFEGFGVSGVVLVRRGPAWNASWVGCVLEGSWGHLGASWKHPGGVRVLEASWELSGSPLVGMVHLVLTSAYQKYI